MTTKTTTSQTAPELPHDVAKQYGLHSEVRVQLPQSSGHKTQGSDVSKSDVTMLDDPKTDKAVEDIMAKESDDLLDASTSDVKPEMTSKGLRHKVRHFFQRWWRNKWARWITITSVAALGGIVSAVPTLRYTVLNTVGVRSSASVVVLDSMTQLPLKNVDVSIGSSKARTDIKGVARLYDLPLGVHTFEVRRLAFASQSRQVTIGWGSNPLGVYKLQAVGTRYSFVITDFLSGRPIEGAEVESDQGNALADKNGNVLLSIDDTTVTSVRVRIQAEGYRSESATLDAATQTTFAQKLVPRQKTVFVSKQSGMYDVFSSDLDGKNKKLLLAGSGLESQNISLVVSPDSKYAMLVSQRENIRDNDGFNLYSLTFLSIDEGTATVVERAQQIQPIDWIGNRFVYRTTVAGASAANAQRNRLISYNYETNARLQLATANQFNVALGAKGMIYFAASSTDPRASLGLFRIKPDGAGRERLSEKEVWTGVRLTRNSLSLQTPDGWYVHTIGDKGIASASAPSTLINHQFRDDPEGTRTAWIDVRDGKGVVLVSQNDGQSKILTSQSGATYPLRWAGPRAIVFRVVTAQESADYVVSPDGGDAMKISDVTPVYGFAQGY